jgi:hypothetical protein
VSQLFIVLICALALNLHFPTFAALLKMAVFARWLQIHLCVLLIKMPSLFMQCFAENSYVNPCLGFWEHLLKMRVNLQKAMIIINQLPQCERLREFVSSIGESDQQAITNGMTSSLNNWFCHLIT